MKYIGIKDVMKMAGMGISHGGRTLRDFGIIPVKRMIQISGTGIATHSRLVWSIDEEEAKTFLKTRGKGLTKLKREVRLSSEDILAKKREQEGWVVIPTYKAGVPDLILLRRDKKGKLELVFEDAKTSCCGISKEQYAFSEKMRKTGFEVKFTWLDD